MTIDPEIELLRMAALGYSVRLRKAEDRASKADGRVGNLVNAMAELKVIHDNLINDARIWLAALAEIDGALQSGATTGDVFHQKVKDVIAIMRERVGEHLELPEGVDDD